MPPFDPRDGPVQVGVTLLAAVACFRGHVKALFNDADRALYRAKAAGKDCVCSATTSRP